jgi:ABC-type iron transport system FetAB ATPase subunit
MKPLDPQRFQAAVMCVALQRSKTKVIEQIRAEGRKVSHYSCREIRELAEAYFAAHMEELIPKAVEDCWTFPMFARYRQQQTQRQPGV